MSEPASLKKECVLITGATGFIGGHIVSRLISDNSFRVVAIVRDLNSYKNTEELEQKGVTLVKGIFYDQDTVEDIFSRFNIQYVIHAAALRGNGFGCRDKYLTVNVKGTEILLKTALKHRVQKFIFFSSVGVFGTIPSTLPAKVCTPLCGDNRYHQSKILAESLVNRYIQKDLNAYIIRPAITYGPGDDGFPAALIKMVKKRTLPLPSRDIEIHLLNVFSLAELTRQVLLKNGINEKILMAADAEPVSLHRLADLIHRHYYGKEYPRYLKMPVLFFRFLTVFFKLLKNEKWLTRIRLISESWYFDISRTVRALEYPFVKTTDAIQRSLDRK